MDYYILISGATGGLGSSVIKECLCDNKIKGIHFLYRNKSKFDNVYKKYNTDKIIPYLYSEEFSYAQYKEYLDNIISEYGIKHLTFVITAFAIKPIKPIGCFSSEEIHDNLHINIEELVYIINILKEKKNLSLKIINIDSGAAYKPLHGWSMYCASKAFVNMFLKTLKTENPEMQIVTYEPGVMDTLMQEEIRNSECSDATTFQEYWKKGILNKTEDVAKDIYHNYIMNWNCYDFEARYSKNTC